MGESKDTNAVVKINVWAEDAPTREKAGKIRYCYAQNKDAKTQEPDWKTLHRGTKVAKRLRSVLDLMEPDKAIFLPDRKRYFLTVEEWEAITGEPCVNTES